MSCQRTTSGLHIVFVLEIKAKVGYGTPKNRNHLLISSPITNKSISQYQRWTLTRKCQIQIATISLFILECKTYYEPVGCFADNQNKPRPIPHYISTDRDYTLPIFSGTLIDWKNWNTFSPEMICRCATLAKTKGHKLFSIQFWGMSKFCLN